MMHSIGLTLAAHPMVEKLQLSVPEIILFVAAVLVMVLGLSPRIQMRQMCGWIAGVALLASAIAALLTPASPNALLPNLVPFGKTLIAVIGVLLVMLSGGAADREYELEVSRGRVFDGIRSTRGEYYAFFLFSLMGLMLCTSADDLIWIFLALELTSLPTYVMVSISTARSKSQEAGVKYFFLGAFGAAMFLYGFALIYGATGSTMLTEIAGSFARDGINPIGMLGLVLAVVGVSFKIAAAPMHFYTPDVYEGAATSVSAFLAFVPKAAGFFVLILLLTTVGWNHGTDGDALPEALHVTLWLMAAATMTIGNVMALLQSNVKRILAYSSIAHSGYMLVGLLAGPSTGAASNGLGAVLFYLMCYGFMNLGAFAVLACLERRPGMEIEDIDDLRGLCRRQPLLGGVMVLCSLSMLGLPPLLGLWGKLYLFTAAISAGE
ncbi:MAG: NADH-quinone oxidoreductase subunit N, partial [Phycisphaerales bacterium]|nr:NADH-quinone oxidoreductase subunit N [Phycisphaerales bacterium]